MVDKMSIILCRFSNVSFLILVMGVSVLVFLHANIVRRKICLVNIKDVTIDSFFLP